MQIRNTFDNPASLLDPVFGSSISLFNLRSISEDEVVEENKNDVELSKTVSTNDDGSFTLRLESYATGTSSTIIQVPVPNDIILVLDESGSMNDCINCGHEMTDPCDTFSFNTTTGEAIGRKVYANEIDKTKTYKIVYRDSAKKYSERTLYWCDICNGWYSSSEHKKHLPAGGSLYSWTPFVSANDTPDYSKTDGDGYHVQFYCNCDDHTETRKEVLQNATTNFLNNVYKDAIGNAGDDDNIDNKIAIVGYGDDSPARIYTIDGTGNYVLNDETAQNAFKSAITEQSIINKGLSNIIDRQATATSRGMEAAQLILENNPVSPGEKRNRIVILFTDGSPGSGYKNNETWANDAIQYAYNIKQLGATIYTIGLFSGADGSDPNNLPIYDVNANGVTNPQFFANGNRFLHLVSSNYPNAKSLTDIGEVIELSENESYYLSTDNKDGLFSIFGKLANEVKPGSTTVELDNTAMVMDVVSNYFQIPNEASNVTAWTETFIGNENWSKDEDSISTVNSGTLQIDINQNKVTVTNFDFAENYVATDIDINNEYVYRGKKLVLEIIIEPSNKFDGSSLVTNESTSGIYIKNDEGEYVPSKIFEIPNIEPNILWESEQNGGSYSGMIKLNKNVNLNGTISIETNKIFILDLNGYVLRSKNGDPLFNIFNGGKLIIIDSDPNKSNYGIFEENIWKYTGNENDIEIKGGIITGFISSDNNAIHLCGELIMNGGTISGNIGNILYIDNGIFSLNTGNIIYNKNNKEETIYNLNGNVIIGSEECYNQGNDNKHKHPIIDTNIYLNGGNITMYCGDIKYNHLYDKNSTIFINEGNFNYYGGNIGIPYDTGIVINNGSFEDKSGLIETPVEYELHYHSNLIPDGKNEELIYNARIPTTKWVTSPKANNLHLENTDNTTSSWDEMLPEYNFVGWEHKTTNEDTESYNLYAIWEEK